MELNDIKIFIELYKNRSISKTADLLGYTQSNISTRLMKLEQEFNTTLFVRAKSGLEILPSTEQFYTYAKAIEEAVNNLYHSYSKKKLPINIGSTQLLSRLYFPTLYLQEAQYNLHTTTVNRLSRNFTNQIYDIIITHTRVGFVDHNINYQSTERLLWASSSNYKSDINNSINVVINRDKQCPLRSLTMEAATSFPRKVSYIEVDTLDLMLSLIYTTNCIALLPDKIILDDTRLCVLEQLPPLSLEVFMYCQKDLDNEVISNCLTNSLGFRKI